MLRAYRPQAAPPLRRSLRPLHARGSRLRYCAAASAAPSSVPAPLPELQRLLAWCAERGAVVHPGLTVARTNAGGGRGLLATQPIAEHVRVARIPLECCITDESADADAATLPWPARIAAALLRARDDPAWAPLVAALPQAAVPVGAFAPWSVLREVQLPHALAAAAESAWLLQHPLREMLQHDEDAWRWALSLALSRTCRPDGSTWPANGVTPLRLVAPLFDLANHSFSEPQLEWAWVAGALELRTARGVAAGEELCISYGEHESAVFYCSYGFAPAPGENPHDITPLFERAAHAARWLDAMGENATRAKSQELDTDDDAPYCAGPGAAVDGRLLQLFEDALGGDADAAVAAVRHRAAELLAELPTSLEQDATALQAVAQVDEEAAMPIRYRIAQKLLLQALVGE